MNTPSDLYNFSICIAALILTLLGLMFSSLTRIMDAKNRHFFVMMFSIMFLYAVSDLVSRFSADYILSGISLFFESFFSSILLLLLTFYILNVAGADYKRSPLFIAAPMLWIIYIIMLLLTQFTKHIYYFTSDNIYHRGPLYPLLLVPPVLIMILNLITVNYFRKELTTKQRSALLIYILVPMAAMIIQMFFYGIYFIILGTVIAGFAMFIFIVLDQIELFTRQQEENARQKANIMVLEMRPHFIFNTMTSIYYLVEQDPGKAQQVIMDFTNYLRGNLSAIVSEKMIPFEKELEHTKAYLAVEEVRFEGKLFVSFDTPYTDFNIPPLMLQPIVENAIKHGIDPDLEALKIRISTQKTEAGSEILVEDSGPGFTLPDDNEPHIALENIRKRLQLMCRGKLEITSNETSGTTVKLILP
ncbi:MAG: histidine kinase [Anaerolineaceae bacterium]|nr:histidine kinase [Anaerolineaceae bacterium]